MADFLMMDECELGIDMCDRNTSVCTKIPNGYYSCTCLGNLTGNGLNCSPTPTYTVEATLPPVTTTREAYSPCNNASLLRTYRCPTVDLCIPLQQLFDYYPDCPNGEDEGIVYNINYSNTFHFPPSASMSL